MKEASFSKVATRSYLEAAAVDPWPFAPINVQKGGCLEADFKVEDDSCLSRIAFFGRALVGRVGELGSVAPSLERLRGWVYEHWRPIGGVTVRLLGASLVCFVFASEHQANRILHMKKWVFYGEPLYLDRWHPLGCSSKNFKRPKMIWIRVMGIPLHLWGLEVFQAIGDRCGGFVRVDEATHSGEELRWARILVTGSGICPDKVSIDVGGWVFVLPICLEEFGTCMFADDFVREKSGRLTQGKAANVFVTLKPQSKAAGPAGVGTPSWSVSPTAGAFMPCTAGNGSLDALQSVRVTSEQDAILPEPIFLQRCSPTKVNKKIDQPAHQILSPAVRPLLNGSAQVFSRSRAPVVSPDVGKSATGDMMCMEVNSGGGVKSTNAAGSAVQTACSLEHEQVRVRDLVGTRVADASQSDASFGLGVLVGERDIPASMDGSMELVKQVNHLELPLLRDVDACVDQRSRYDSFVNICSNKVGPSLLVSKGGNGNNELPPARVLVPTCKAKNFIPLIKSGKQWSNFNKMGPCLNSGKVLKHGVFRQKFRHTGGVKAKGLSAKDCLSLNGHMACFEATEPSSCIFEGRVPVSSSDTLCKSGEGCVWELEGGGLAQDYSGTAGVPLSGQANLCSMVDLSPRLWVELGSLEGEDEGSRRLSGERTPDKEGEDWVSSSIGGFSNFLGIDFEGNDKEALTLFRSIEERRRVRVEGVEKGVCGSSNGVQ